MQFHAFLMMALKVVSVIHSLVTLLLAEELPGLSARRLRQTQKQSGYGNEAKNSVTAGNVLWPSIPYPVTLFTGFYTMDKSKVYEFCLCSSDGWKVNSYLVRPTWPPTQAVVAWVSMINLIGQYFRAIILIMCQVTKQTPLPLVHK